MDSLLELRAAFAKIIVSYRNKKVAENLKHLDVTSFVKAPDSIAAVKNCMEETIKIERSKATHLALFYDVFFMLDKLSNDYTPQDEYSRLALINELILIIQTLYLLNHDGCSHEFSFSGKRDTLTTTVKFGGYGPGITDLGDSIRDHILLPLGGSGDSIESANSKAVANKHIADKIAVFFEEFKKQETIKIEKDINDKKLVEQEQQLLKLKDLLLNVNGEPNGVQFEEAKLDIADNLEDLMSSSSSIGSGLGFFDSSDDVSVGDPGYISEDIDGVSQKKTNPSGWSLSSLWSL